MVVEPHPESSKLHSPDALKQVVAPLMPMLVPKESVSPDTRSDMAAAAPSTISVT